MIEDNKSVSEMMQMFFQKEGWDVTFAYDGIEAMDKFNEDPESWDMITLDLNLPKKKTVWKSPRKFEQNHKLCRLSC